MGTTFTAGGGSVTLSRDPQLENGETWGRIQSKNRTQDGLLMVVDKGTQVRQFSLTYIYLTDTDKDNLETFVNTYAIGGAVIATYTDTHGVRWYVRFLDDRLNWTESWDPGDGWWNLSIELEVVGQVSVS